MAGLALHLVMASTYGSSTYGSGVYGGSAPLLQVGPLTLPNTGAGWMVLISAVLLAVAAGWAAWLWGRRRARAKAH